MNLLERISLKIDNGIHYVFGKLGSFVADRPVITICIVLAVTATMINGAWFYDEELSEDNQFAPLDSRAVKERDRIEEIFGYDERPLISFFITETDLLTPEGFRLMQSYYTWLTQNHSATYKNETLYYKDVCERLEPGLSCKAPEGILQYYNFSTEKISQISSKEEILDLINQPNSWRTVSPSGPPLSFYLADTEMESLPNGTSRIVSAKVARFYIYLKNDKEKLSGIGEDDPRSREWELGVSEVTEEEKREQGIQSTAANIETWVLTLARYDIDSQSAIDQDVSTLIIGYILMTLYTMYVLSRSRLKYSHASIGLVSVISVGMATISAYGFCWYIGVKYNNVVAVLALVLLGIGVDDTFVIMDMWWDNALITNMKDRLVAAVSHAGSAILVTSVTDFVAFAAGSSTVLPALRDFCIYAMMGIVFDFSYQITFVVALVYLDSVRQSKNKMDIIVCKDVEEDTGCLVDKSKKFSELERTMLDRFVGTNLPRLTVGTIIGKCVIIGVTLAFVSVGIWGCTEVRQNFNRDWFLPSSSESAKAIDIREDYFNGGQLPISVYNLHITDYPDAQVEIEKALRLLEGSKWTVENTTSSWLRSFTEWVASENPSNITREVVDSSFPLSQSELDSNQNYINTVNKQHFYTLLREFISYYTGPDESRQYIPDLKWSDDAKTTLVADRSQIYIIGDTIADGEKAVSCLDDLRQLLDENLGEGATFVWTRAFVFWEGFKVMMRETYRNVIIAGSTVFVLVSLVTANFYLGFLVIVSIAGVDVCLVGWMVVIGVEVNSVSVICIVLAVGLAVDYSVHIAKAFLHAKAEDVHGYSKRTHRAAYALWKMGPAVVNGGVSTFIAVLPLVGAVSYVFTVFFRMFVLIIGFGLWFGVFFLPVLLSLIGPAPLSNAESLEEHPWSNPLSPDYDKEHGISSPEGAVDEEMQQNAPEKVSE